MFYLQLEEAHGLCDPNPTEYIDMDVKEPNVVFYWGLQNTDDNKACFTDIESVEVDFMKNINTGYVGSFGGLELSIVQASQLPKHAAGFDTASRKGTRACWKIIDYNRQRMPIYSQHLRQYVIGYVATNGNSTDTI